MLLLRNPAVDAFVSITIIHSYIHFCNKSYAARYSIEKLIVSHMHRAMYVWY